jgi:LAO/AO transport system kinase
MGDDVQAIKAGIMEIADVFAINKSDLPGAERLEQDLRAMQSVANDVGCTKAAPIRRVISTDGTGVHDLMKVIHDAYVAQGSQSRNVAAWSFRLRELLRDQLLESLPENAIEKQAARVAAKIEDPYTALAALTSLVKNSHGH